MAYHEHTDRQYFKNIREGAPEATAALMAFDDAALRGESKVVDRKTTELIAVAVALTTQCVYCIESHSAAARKEGATEAELAETIMITTALRAGGGIAHGRMAMKFYDQADQS